MSRGYNLNLKKYTKRRYRFKDSEITWTIKEAYLSYLTSNKADKPFIRIQAFEAVVLAKLNTGEIVRA